MLWPGFQSQSVAAAQPARGLGTPAGTRQRNGERLGGPHTLCWPTPLCCVCGTQTETEPGRPATLTILSTIVVQGGFDLP